MTMASLNQWREELSLEMPFAKVRVQAFEKALKQGMPSAKGEGYRQFPVSKLIDMPWKLGKVDPQFVLDVEEESTLVFVNGHYVPSLSKLSDDVIALPFSAAEKKFKTFLSSRFQKTLKEEDDFFALLNFSMHGEGLFLYVPPEQALSRPVHVRHFITEEQVYAAPRLHLHVGAHSTLTIHFSTDASTSDYWNHMGIDLSLEERSNVTMKHSITEKEGGWNFLQTRAHIKRAGSLGLYATSDCSGVLLEDHRMTLAQEEARATIKGLVKGDGNGKIYSTIGMHHAAPRTFSTQHIKGALSGSSKHRFFGQVTMEKVAKDAEAKQRSEHLLLSKHAQAIATPRLRIFNPDVQAAHGATVADLDEESLFYLQSRGMPRAAAKELLVDGFCQAILEEIEEATC